MSELKATTVYDAYWKANSVGEGTGVLVYLKSEADKVIAELKESVKGLILDNYLKDKEIRHHKYKRCLAMARWCDSEANYWYDSSKVQQCWRYGHYISWFNKWSKLADQFTDKEAK